MNIDKLYIYNNIEDTDYLTGTYYLSGNSVLFEYSEEWYNNQFAYEINCNCPLNIKQKNVAFDVTNIKHNSRLISYKDFYYPFYLLYLYKNNLIDKSSFDVQKLYKWLDTKQERYEFDEKFYKIPDLTNLVYQNDLTRIGSLRIKTDKNNNFLMNNSEPIPNINEIDNIIDIIDKVKNKSEKPQELQQFADCASNLKGWVPKINILDDSNNLCIAKIASYYYDYIKFARELFALNIARKMKIKTQEYQVKQTKNFKYLLLKRFDRNNGKRIPMIHFTDYADTYINYYHDIDIVKLINKICKDNNYMALKEFFRRKLLRICLKNAEEFTINTSFLMSNNGTWNIAPEYDIAVGFSRRLHNDDGLKKSIEKKLQRAINNSFLYGISREELQEILHDLKYALTDWQQEALNASFKEDDLALINIYNGDFSDLKF